MRVAPHHVHSFAYYVWFVNDIGASYRVLYSAMFMFASSVVLLPPSFGQVWCRQMGFQSMMDTMNYEIRVEYRSRYQNKILMMAERRVNQIILPRMVRERGGEWKQLEGQGDREKIG